METYKAMGLTGYKMGKESQVITKQKISNIENGVQEVTSEMLSEFAITYQTANINYILTGKGNMFVDEDQQREASNANALSKEEQNKIKKDLEEALSQLEEVRDTMKVLKDVIRKQLLEIEELQGLLKIHDSKIHMSHE